MGYIKLHRKIFDWEWYGKPTMVTMWLHILLSANYEDKVWRGVLVERGSFMTSLSTLAAETGLSIQEVRTCLNKLQNSTQINIQTTHQATKITVCNYDSYQCNDHDEQQTINTRCNNQITRHIEDNTSSSTDVDSEDIIKENKNKKDSGTKVPSQKEVVDKLYAIYPSSVVRPDGNKVALRSAKDKEKIARLLSNGHSAEDLESTIRRYVADTNPAYLKLLATFLNNLPDYSYPELPGQPTPAPAQRNNKSTFTFVGVKRG